MGPYASKQETRKLVHTARVALMHSARLAVGASLFVFSLAAAAQGTAPADSTPPPANDNAAQAQPAEAMPSNRAHNHRKAMRHAMHSTSDQASTQGDHAYRRALRACVTQSDAERDSCLDNAIEQFGRNT